MRKKATIHQVTTMLANSKNVLFPSRNHLLTIGTDDLTLWLSPERIALRSSVWAQWRPFKDMVDYIRSLHRTCKQSEKRVRVSVLCCLMTPGLSENIQCHVIHTLFFACRGLSTWWLQMASWSSSGVCVGMYGVTPWHHADGDLKWAT